MKYLLAHSCERKELGKNAYLTMASEWNAENAAKRFLALVEGLNKNGRSDLFKEGPCSKAKIIKNNWFKEG